jgi:hypothetical protein
MTSMGKMIFGFMIIGLCLVGTIMIFAQQASTPIGNLTIGNTDEYMNTSSTVNQTATLVSETTTYGSGAVVVVLFILGGMIVIGAIALIAGRK